MTCLRSRRTSVAEQRIVPKSPKFLTSAQITEPSVLMQGWTVAGINVRFKGIGRKACGGVEENLILHCRRVAPKLLVANAVGRDAEAEPSLLVGPED